MGYGVVGSGVAEVLLKNARAIEKRACEPIIIEKILDLRDFDNDPLKDKFTKNFADILNDKSIGVVAEVMGGITPSYDYVKALLKAHKSVVTSNKELVAAKGAELLKIAEENNVNFLFEASVGGGIPVIRPLHQCLAANEIDEVCGILNGTTNYILTKMIKEHRNFDEVLKEAQALGYAERNPSADIEGHDACRKICILASLAYGRHVYPENVHTEGITSITLEDVSFAAKAGYVVKLLGKAKRLENDDIYILVSPMLIEAGHILATVDDVFNAILIKGNATGDVMFYGKGAGKLPTASAVVADIIDCIKHVKARKWLYWEDSDDSFVTDYKKGEVSIYVNFKVTNNFAALNKANEIFCGLNLIESDKDKLVFITPVMPEEEFDNKIKSLENENISLVSKIRLM